MSESKGIERLCPLCGNKLSEDEINEFILAENTYVEELKDTLTKSEAENKQKDQRITDLSREVEEWQADRNILQEKVDELTAGNQKIKDDVVIFAAQLQAWGYEGAGKEVIDEILGGSVNAPDYYAMKERAEKAEAALSASREDADRLAEELRHEQNPGCACEALRLHDALKGGGE